MIFRWRCKKCRHKKKYSEKYDSYYCDNCDEWAEGTCSDPGCEFCSDRPDKPSSVNIVTLHK